MNIFKSPVAATVAVLLAGCTVGPNFKQPDADVYRPARQRVQCCESFVRETLEWHRDWPPDPVWAETLLLR